MHCRNIHFSRYYIHFGQIFDAFGTHDLPFYSFLSSLIEQSAGSDKLFKVDVEP